MSIADVADRLSRLYTHLRQCERSNRAYNNIDKKTYLRNRLEYLRISPKEHSTIRLVRSNNQIRIQITVQINSARQREPEGLQERVCGGGRLLSRDGLGIEPGDALVAAVVDVDHTSAFSAAVWGSDCYVWNVQTSL